MDQSHIDEANIEEASTLPESGYDPAAMTSYQGYPLTLGVSSFQPKGDGLEVGGAKSEASGVESAAISGSVSSNGTSHQQPAGMGMGGCRGEEIGTSMLPPQIATTAAESSINRSMLENLRRVAAQYTRIRQVYDTYKGKLPGSPSIIIPSLPNATH